MQKISKKENFAGWIKKIRRIGSIVFFTTIFDGKEKQIIAKNELAKETKHLKKGDLVNWEGQTKIKDEREEIELKKFKLINKSDELPFEFDEIQEIKEENKYIYRYLELRKKKSREPLLKKNEFLFAMREFLHKKGFIDIETPILSQASPEGASCFISLSKLENRYYTLSQSAQIFKQILMVGGFKKYYQIAKSFRNEDARSNRQIEFSQLEIEMSFTNFKKMKSMLEKMLSKIIWKTFGIKILTPFPVFSYQEIWEKYKSEKPNIKTNEGGLNFLWINKWPLFEYDKKKRKYISFRHPFTIPVNIHIKKFFENKIKPENIIAEAFDLICNGEEILSGSMRINERALQEKVLETLGYKKKEMEEKFGYFLKALGFAAPPHGGFGLGIDRLLMVIMNLGSLKETLAFPKNIDGTCSLTGAPDLLFLEEKDDSNN